METNDSSGIAALNAELFKSIEDNDVPGAERWLDKGADIEFRAKGNQTPLMSSSYISSEMVDMLVRRGADIRASDREGFQAIHIAAFSGHKECLESLLRAGANVNAQTNDGSTPAILLVVNGFFDALKTIHLSYGADLSLKDYNGNDPFFHAFDCCRIDIAAYIATHERVDLASEFKSGITYIEQAKHNGWDLVVSQHERRLLKEMSRIHDADFSSGL